MVEPKGPSLREAIAHFDDAKKLEAAVSALQSHGFNRADISFVTREGVFGEHAGAPHEGHAAPIESSDVKQGRTLMTSMAAVIAAFAAAGFTVATGGAAAVAVGAAAVAGLGVGGVGAALGQAAGASERNYVGEQLERGGVVLWVRIQDGVAEQRALAVLRDEGGIDVHLRDVPAARV
jgi:hypothetical protein